LPSVPCRVGELVLAIVRLCEVQKNDAVEFDPDLCRFVVFGDAVQQVVPDFQGRVEIDAWVS
jgi:hypothetical protein